ncbi:MAG: undecaprenyl-diphosphate phosphatase [Coriobacteriia bacterium]|nr:undecaprenyl-diphosphate phosphatase [Coriobacteriia bacterium]
MPLLQALVLGVVQGLTEFLPVSSDGHLAVTYRLFGGSPDLTFEVFLHLATLIAMVVYFRGEILELLRSLAPAGKGTPERRIVWLIVLGTGVTGVLGLAMKGVVEDANTSLIAIGAGFLVTAAALAAAELLSRRVERLEPSELGPARAVGVAVAQALATLPGVSRSGMTIAGGMLCGLTREAAARFAFLLGIPIIAAANLLEAKDIVAGAAPMPKLVPSAVGFLAAGIVGYFAIAALLAVVKRRTLWLFSVYTAVVGVAVIVWGTIAR